MPGRASGIKMVGMTEMGAPISLDGVPVHLDCWCVYLCYLHFTLENPEDGEIYLLVPAHPGYPGQSPESCKMVVRVVQKWYKLHRSLLLLLLRYPREGCKELQSACLHAFQYVLLLLLQSFYATLDFAGTTQVSPNGIQIQSTVFPQSSRQTDTHRDSQTDRWSK